MKSFIAILPALAFLASAAPANILGQFTFSGSHPANEPTVVQPWIHLSDLSGDGLSLEQPADLGAEKDGFAVCSGWDTLPVGLSTYLNRGGRWQWPKTVGFQAKPAAESGRGFLHGLSVDVKQPSNAAPNTIMAAIFWEDETGVVQQRHSSPVDLAAADGWVTLELDFVNGSAAFPAGAAFLGECFNIELYAWGGKGGALYLDNLTLTGDFAPIPEPGGALLIAMAGLTLIFRRRLR